MGLNLSSTLDFNSQISRPLVSVIDTIQQMQKKYLLATWLTVFSVAVKHSLSPKNGSYLWSDARQDHQISYFLDAHTQVFHSVWKDFWNSLFSLLFVFMLKR